MWVPLSHPFVMGVSIINHPAIGISPFDNKHGRIMIKYFFILVPLCSILAHLLLLSSHSYSALIFSRRVFSSLTLPTSAFPSVHIGSLTSKLPSIIIFYPRVPGMVFPYFLNHGTVFHSEFNRWSSPKIQGTIQGCSQQNSTSSFQQLRGEVHGKASRFVNDEKGLLNDFSGIMLVKSSSKSTVILYMYIYIIHMYVYI